jgi:hypothetical protein
MRGGQVGCHFYFGRMAVLVAVPQNSVRRLFLVHSAGNIRDGACHPASSARDKEEFPLERG